MDLSPLHCSPAQLSSQYLAEIFSSGDPLAAGTPPFQYRYLGSMAQVGDWKAVADLKGIGGPKGGPILEGFVAFLTWRSAYWTKTVRYALEAR